MCIYVLGEKETMPYFAAHFEQQLQLYEPQVGLLYIHVNLKMYFFVVLIK